MAKFWGGFGLLEEEVVDFKGKGKNTVKWVSGWSKKYPLESNPCATIINRKSGQVGPLTILSLYSTTYIYIKFIIIIIKKGSTSHLNHYFPFSQ